MLKQILRYTLLAGFLLECPFALRAQVAPAGAGPMLKPPPVSGQSYRIETEMGDRSNYLSGGISAGGGYIDNLYPGTTVGERSEATFTIQPTIAFDTSTPRQHTTAAYTPTFLLYAPTTALNEADHNASLNFDYRFTPQLSLALGDRLLRSSTGFAQIGSGGISGSNQQGSTLIPTPFGERFLNYANGTLSYQFSPHGMIGGTGNVGFLNYPNSSQTNGLYDNDSRGGGGFYNHRLSYSQYLGAIYQYQQTLAYPQGSEYVTDTHTIYGFYTIYLTEKFSVSAAGGPQRYTEAHAPFPTVSDWSPSITASLGWQNPHTSFAANYSRTVTGGSGLLGAFHSTSAGATGRWQISRLWAAGLNLYYTINKNATPMLPSSSGGHSLIGSVSLGRALSTNTKVLFSYDRIQNKYETVTVINANPSSDRMMASFVWNFRRPIGR